MKAFTCQSTDFALTYPQCDLLPSTLLQFFRGKFDGKVTYCAVVQEKHESGDFHLHAQVQFANRFKATERTFDILTFHPNVQMTKDSLHWKKYMEKSGVPETSGEWAHLRKAKKEKLTNKELLEGDLQELIDSERLPLLSLVSVLNARKAYEEIKKRPSPDLPSVLPGNWDGLELPVLPITEKRRHYWLYSSVPNKGKSTFLENLGKLYRAAYYSCSEKYQTINADSQLLLFDEYGKGNSVTATVMNQICDGSYKFPCKSRPAVELKKPYVIICSNYSISDVYLSREVQTRILARFNEICLDNYEFI